MINKITSKLGFNIQRLRKLNSYPYKRKFTYKETSFNFWIADETAKKWYDVGFNNNLVELEILDQMIDKSDNVLEIGVHYGFFASFIASKINEGRYLGVEMQPKAAMYTQANLKLNGFFNAEIINAAGGSQVGEISYNPHLNGNAIPSKNDKGQFDIPVITIDEIIEREGGFNFLKIDVEGFELEVLKGGRKKLSQFNKIAIEIHNNLLKKNELNELIEILNINSFDGKMFMRPDYKLENIDVDKIIKSNGIVNLFLWK